MRKHDLISLCPLTACGSALTIWCGTQMVLKGHKQFKMLTNVTQNVPPSPIHRRATQRPTKQTTMNNHEAKDNLERAINLTVMVLDCGRIPEYLERTHTWTRRTCTKVSFLLNSKGKLCLFIVRFP
ncbi:hypothetical protein AMECASPLE_012723 [Ameca splendens]|uniref:Secreted protein n=1 Tax=Ameca splendens TaxID=208324 RepID=A0ABV0XEB1_9TELE